MLLLLRTQFFCCFSSFYNTLFCKRGGAKLSCALFWALASAFSHADTPPLVSISTPSDAMSLEGVVDITGQVSDDGTVASLELRINDGPWLGITPQQNWQYSWISEHLAGSVPVTISVRATDDAAQQSETSVQVTVNNPKVPLPLDATIVAIGNSITAGNGGLSWPDSLNTLLIENNRADVTVINEGEGGLSSKELWLDAAHENFKKTAIAAHPSIDIALLTLGHNDTRQDDLTWHAVSVADFTSNMQNVIDWLKGRSNANGRETQVVLMTVIPAAEPVINNRWRFPSNFNELIQQPGGYTDAMLHLAEVNNIELLHVLPVFDGGPSAYSTYRRANSDLMFRDTIHPSAAGYSALAELVLTKLDLSSMDSIPPVAQAGSDKTIVDNDNDGVVSFSLDGTASSDVDGNIVDYQWFNQGVLFASGQTPTVSLPLGTHTLELLVEDNDGLIHSDWVDIVVVADTSVSTEATAEFAPLADTYIDVRYPDTNYGPLSSLQVGAGSAERWIYLRFDLSGIPSGASLLDAKITMHGSNGGGAGTISVFYPDEPLWDESSPTWANPLVGVDSGVALDSPSAVRIGANTQYQNLVSALPVSGPVSFVIRSQDLNGSAFRSQEFVDSDVRPVLTVTYEHNTGTLLPTADAGPDQNIIDFDDDGVESINLDASHSNGDPVAYYWRENGVLIANGLNPTVSLAVGLHTLELEIVDNDGISSFDTVNISIDAYVPLSPTANAGPDQTLMDEIGDGFASVTLDAKDSFDPDGSLVSYQWFNANELLGTGESILIDLPLGTHTIELVVEDNNGLQATDLVEITVTPYSPGAQTFTLNLLPDADTYIDSRFPSDNYGSSSSLQLGGGSAERLMYLRFELNSLPSNVNILDAYLTFMASNSGGAGSIRGFDPVDSAWDESLPSWSSPLQGEETTADLGSPSSVIKGRLAEYRDLSSAIPTGQSSVNFVIRSADADGAAFRSAEYPVQSHRPQLTIIYQSANGLVAPVADAGEDQSVSDTDNDGLATVLLNGGGSDDLDGTIQQYHWEKDGLVIATGVTASVDLEVGFHSIVLEVVDNDGLIHRDTVEINVLAGTQSQNTMNFYPVADTHIDVRYPTQNFGSDTYLGVAAGSSERWIYLRFDISGLPPEAVISDANLQMRATNSGGAGAIRLFLPETPSWSEDGPTWNEKLAGSDGSSDLASPGYVAKNTFVNYSGLASVVPVEGAITFVIRSSDADGSAFRSSEYSSLSEKPVLTISY